VSILPTIFWQQQIRWSYCAASRRFGLVAWRNTVPRKRSLGQENAVPACGVTVKCYGCYALSNHKAYFMVFSSTVTLPTFFLPFLFFRLRLGVTFSRG